MEIRSVLGFFMLYPLVRMNGGFATMWTSRPLQHIGRNLIHYAAQLGWFFALTLIPLGQVVLIEHGAGDAVCGRNRRAAHGFPEGSADRRRRLADLFGAAGHVHFAWRCADPCRQSLEPQSRRSGACARRSLGGPVVAALDYPLFFRAARSKLWTRSAASRTD
jgi:hypothetical protein